MIEDTISNSRPYALIVDADVDGFCSASIIYQYLKLLNPQKKIDYFLHEGKQHGLPDLWEKIQAKNRDYCAVIIPDAGSNNSQYALQFECPILVLDHHLLEDVNIAPNMILVNNQTSPRYVNKDLSGAGVTWQFCRAMDSHFGKNFADQSIDLCALALVGDMMSMLSYENQYIVQTGFLNVKNKFLQAILDKQSYSMGGAISPISVAFYVVPLINGMIRMGAMEEKERLFLAFVDSDRLVPCNKRGAKGAMERVAIESLRECVNAKSHQDKEKEKIVERLEQKIFKYDLLENEVLFIRLEDDDDFPAELNGLCAMILATRYNKPAIVARLNEDGFIRGSARVPSNAPIESFKDYLSETGLFEYAQGHHSAFGLSISNDNLFAFHQKANRDFKDVNFGEKLWYVDFARKANEKDLPVLIYDLEQYNHIWGQQNPKPLILVKDIFITKNDVQIIGKNKDTIKIEKNGISYMKFRAKDDIEKFEKFNEMRLEIIGEGNINEWGGMSRPQIFIKDFEIHNSLLDF